MTRYSAIWKSGCPSDLEWAELAASQMDNREADRLLNHAAECGSCASVLKETLFLLREGEEATPDARDLGAEYETRIPALAHWAAEQARRRSGVRGAMERLAAAAWSPRVAAPGALAAGVALVVVLWQPSPPLSGLAAAYSARRTVELRVSGASYAPLRVNKSSRPADMSPELLESQAKIQRHLDRAPDDARWLHAWGRAQVLTWQFDGAIKSFQAAASAGASSPEFWVDYATAYFERAEDRRNPADYRKAVELLDLALQHRPLDPVVLFNRAVVNDRLSRPDEAIRDLQLCIEAENDNGWKEEAARLLEQIRQRRQSSG